MHGLLAPFLSDSFALIILHKPAFRGRQGENIAETGDRREYWNRRKDGGNYGLWCTQDSEQDVERGNTKEQKVSKRKS